MRAKNSTEILTVGSLLLAACGGKGAVDLGGNVGNAGWADTKGTIPTDPDAGQVTRMPSAVPETLYDGDLVRAFAVDDSTIAVALQSVAKDETRLDICQFADCRGTRQTVYKVPDDPTLDATSVSGQGSLDAVTISHGEIVFWDSVNNGAGNRLMACSTAGCPQGARQVTPTVELGELVGDASYFYWSAQGNPGSGIARCPRVGCQIPEFKSIPDTCIHLFYSGTGGGSHLALDETRGMLYASMGVGIASMPLDFSGELTPFYEEPLGVEGLAIVGEYVYFAIPTLTGQIRRCPTSGCQLGSELVVSAPRWPRALLADEKALFWQHDVVTNLVTPSEDDQTLATFRMDGSTGVTTVVEKLPHQGIGMGLCNPAVNSHHVYWCDSGTQSPFPPLDSAIRMIAR